MNTLQSTPLYQKLLRQKQITGKFFVLFTDIDGTFIYEHEKVTETTQKLQKLLADKHIPIVAVSGRDLLSLERLQASTSYKLDFDALIGSVGTEIWIRQNNSDFLKHQPFTDYIKDTLRFDRNKIYFA